MTAGERPPSHWNCGTEARALPGLLCHAWEAATPARPVRWRVTSALGRTGATAAAQRRRRTKSHEKRSEQTHAGAKPQGPESAHAGLRIQRSRRESPRDSQPRRREIRAAGARRADLGRPGGGGELLSARRALLPPDARRAGNVPAEQSLPPPRRGTARREFRRGG